MQKNLVVFEGTDEVLICLKEDEHRVLKEWFVEGGRDIDDYDRSEKDVVQIVPRCVVS